MALVPGDYYDQSIRENVFQRYWHSRRFSEVGRFLKRLKAKKILDVGCHGGRFTYEISRKFPAASLFGIDISPIAVKYAIKKYPHFHFQVARAEKLPFKDNFFDLVTCLEVLEHVHHPQQVLKEIKRVLKKRGIFIILVPSENFLFRVGWFFWVRFGPGHVWQDAHLQKFKSNTLDSLLKNSDFKILRRKQFLLGMLLLIKTMKKD